MDFQCLLSKSVMAVLYPVLNFHLRLFRNFLIWVDCLHYLLYRLRLLNNFHKYHHQGNSKLSYYPPLEHNHFHYYNYHQKKYYLTRLHGNCILDLQRMRVFWPNLFPSKQVMWYRWRNFQLWAVHFYFLTGRLPRWNSYHKCPDWVFSKWSC